MGRLDARPGWVDLVMEQDQAPLVGTAAEHVGYLDEVDLIGASGIRDDDPPRR